MNSTKNTLPRPQGLIRAGLVLALPLVLLALSFLALRFQRPSKPLPVYLQVADFTLTNQFGRPVTLKDLRGHPWVADIIFTRCPGPCLKMTRQMKELQEALPASNAARLVTLTTDPGFDTPSVLERYGERFNADSNRWTFLTGTKAQLRRLAVDSLKLSALPKSKDEQTSPDDLYVHSTIFVLIDQEGRLRQIYETTGEGIDPAQVKARILADVRQLEREG